MVEEINWIKVGTCVGISSVSVLILGPFLVYSTRQYNKYKETLILRKRHPNLVICNSILMIATLLIRVPLILWLEAFKNNLNDTIFSIGIAIEAFLYSSLSHGMAYANFCRYWFVYYEFSLEYLSENQIWKKIINPINVDNWFLIHKSDYGNLRWFIAHLILPIFCPIAIIDSVLIVGSKLYQIPPFQLFMLIDGAFFFTPLIGLILLWKKTPDFHDNVLISGLPLFFFSFDFLLFCVFLLDVMLSGLNVLDVGCVSHSLNTNQN